ncbi:endoplasmic reticulum metallopeptidase 1-like [Drosophila innubila]|uniref:endoplasmic reticulum metallopeptidase 1-like n=1 Tax=Drosophila innubila TaxID=198719 RepID=UPI00148DF28A|nr:endoplasmic reticulum metallopeptidase 1-like [Drosophila innubila]
MSDKEKLISDESAEDPQNATPKEVTGKLPWYFACGFLMFLGLLFFAIVIPLFYRLPTAMTMEDANRNVFIAERAYKNLYTLSNIGNKLTGSRENEIEAVNFIMKEVTQIQKDCLKDYFDLEIDLSQVSGGFPYKTVLNTYQGAQNIAVKLAPKNSTSKTYLLVNSHFDSKPATPSAGDAGFMIVTMLEVLRVIATTMQAIEHPIVFLFNGLEEGSMQASHGFIKQHRWAPYCKAVVNLDGGGGGGREILFQTGPNHPWLAAAHKTGHAVYYDFLGLYFFYYSEATGKCLNYAVAGAALILILISIWRMADASQVTICHVIRWFILVMVIQIVSFVLGLALPIVVAYGMDSFGLSLTYYSTPMLIVGLYVCPSLIGLSLPITIYYSLQRNDKISTSYHLQLALHSQAVILALLATSVTALGFRSSYIFVIPLLFYVISLALNLMTILHDLGFAWAAFLKLSQIIPFLYSSYLVYIFIVVMTPMGGRSGSGSNRDLFIAVLAAVGTVLSFGFLVPLINTFRRPSFMIFALLATTALSLYLASSTQLGFPYRPKTSGQRVAYLHVRNKFYDYDGTLSKDESGYLFNFQDRREETPFVGTNVNLTGMVSIKSNCERYMMCGMPLYDYRYVQNRLQSKWLPRSEPVETPDSSNLELLSKTIVNSTTCRFEFNLTGPSHMSIFIQPYEDVIISNWSFERTYLENPPEAPLSYHIYFTYGIDDSPLNFFVECSKPDGDFKVPLFQLGVSWHYIGHEGDSESKKLKSSFPSYSIVAEWPVLYKRYIF